jgi:ABC-type multidrug transport system fused ATPase/permease subunit
MSDESVPRKVRALVFLDRYAVATIVLIAMHQSLIASSVYFLSGVIQAFEQGLDFATDLLFYLMAMTAPFIPGCLSFVTMQQWENRAHGRVAQALIDSVRGRVGMYRSAERREAFESAVSRNAIGAVSGYIALFHDFLSLLLNSVLSIAVVGLLLPSHLLLGYGLSVMLALAIIVAMSAPIRKQSEEVEGLYARYGNCLATAWDNTTLGNAYNADLWDCAREKAGQAYYTAATALAGNKQFGNLLIAWASLIPTAYLIYDIATTSHASAAVLAVIIVNLTRIFHILNSLGTLIFQMLEWASAKTRLRFLFAMCAAPGADDELPSGPIGNVWINDVKVDRFETVVRQLRDQKAGRYTVRGANGAGKSTMLLALKKAFPADAYLLPIANADLSWIGDYRNFSTGQRMRRILAEVCSCTQGVRYLLLDEWDANLDAQSRLELDQLLTNLSSRFVVVEVLH